MSLSTFLILMNCEPNWSQRKVGLLFWLCRSSDCCLTTFLYLVGLLGATNNNPNVDRVEVLSHLYECETQFQQAKIHQINTFLDAYEHSTEPRSSYRLINKMMQLFLLRPRLDLSDDNEYFVTAYMTHVATLERETKVLTEALEFEINQHRITMENYVIRAYNVGSSSSGGGKDNLQLSKRTPFASSSFTSNMSLTGSTPSLRGNGNKKSATVKANVDSSIQAGLPSKIHHRMTVNSSSSSNGKTHLTPMHQSCLPATGVLEFIPNLDFIVDVSECLQQTSLDLLDQIKDCAIEYFSKHSTPDSNKQQPAEENDGFHQMQQRCELYMANDISATVLQLLCGKQLAVW